VWGDATNTIGPDRAGQEWMLLVNGAPRVSATDCARADDCVGPVAGTWDVPTTEVHVHAFTVRKP
jgi:hypothetical protein